MEDGVHVDLDDLDFDREHLIMAINRGHIDTRDTTLNDVVRVQLPQLIRELRARREAAERTPLLMTSDYQVMTFDDMSHDEPTRGWMPISSITIKIEHARERLRHRREAYPHWPELAIWRRDITWTLEATQDEVMARGDDAQR